MSDQLFLKASRLKTRFETPKGNLPVEDLWELPLNATNGRANLDDIAIELHRRIKSTETDTVSFVSNAERRTDEELTLKFELVKHVIATLVAEKETETQRRANAVRKGKLVELLAKKQDEKLANSTEEDITKMINELQ